MAGALNILGSSLGFAILGALVRLASESLPNEVVVFFRNAMVLVFLVPLFALRGKTPVITPGKTRFHLIRAASGLAAMYCYFYALAHMKLAEAVLLSYTTPLFIPIIALVWLREPIGPRVRGAVVIGFAGVLLILKPGFSIFEPVALLAVAASLFSSFAMVSIRRMADTERPDSIVFYYTLFATLISALPLFRSWQTPGGTEIVVIIAIGITAMIAQLLITRGYSLAPAAQVGPFVYCTVIFASIIGWIFWDESLNLLSLAGAVLIFMAGIMSIQRVRQPAPPP